MTPHVDPPPTSGQPPERASSRPAMPSGTVRARRAHARHRKGKARFEASLEPAAPASLDQQNQPTSGRSNKQQRNSARPSPSSNHDQQPHQIVQQILNQHVLQPVEALATAQSQPHRVQTTQQYRHAQQSQPCQPQPPQTVLARKAGPVHSNQKLHPHQRQQLQKQQQPSHVPLPSHQQASQVQTSQQPPTQRQLPALQQPPAQERPQQVPSLQTPYPFPPPPTPKPSQHFPKQQPLEPTSQQMPPRQQPQQQPSQCHSSQHQPQDQQQNRLPQIQEQTKDVPLPSQQEQIEDRQLQKLSATGELSRNRTDDKHYEIQQHHENSPQDTSSTVAPHSEQTKVQGIDQQVQRSHFSPEVDPAKGPTSPLEKIANVENPPSPRLIVDLTPQSQHSSSVSPKQNGSTPPRDETASQPDCNQRVVDDVHANDREEISRLAAKARMPAEAGRARPLICQDITNSNADTLRISRLPRGVTYDRLLSMVEPFGEVEDLTWTASDPYVCDVTYRDPSAAREAKHFLGDALVGNDSEPPLKAELRSRDPGAQLFVGDLTPDVTEEMLEDHFSELVGEPVSALLKRDPESFSPIGYGFLSFKNESSANFALVAGHRAKIGNARVRVGRAERNTHLYVSDLAPDISLEELKILFSKFGSLVDEDTVIVRRSYAFIRYRNRGAAEKAKRTLDKTDLKGKLSVRYAEAEPLKACVAVQFHSSVPRPPNSLRDLLSATFSKHGNCSVEIPRLQNGMWRKVAFVTYHGEPLAANLAALEAVQSVRFVSSLPVCCQFARELIPRLPSHGLQYQKLTDSGGGARPLSTCDRRLARSPLAKNNSGRSLEQGGVSDVPRTCEPRQAFENQGQVYSAEHDGQQTSTDFVPIFVPITALQHPGQVVGNGGQVSEVAYPAYQQPLPHRVVLTSGSNTGQNLNPGASHFTPGYQTFPSAPDQRGRW